MDISGVIINVLIGIGVCTHLTSLTRGSNVKLEMPEMEKYGIQVKDISHLLLLRAVVRAIWSIKKQIVKVYKI